MAMRILVVALALGCAQSVVVRSKSPPVDIPQQNFMAQGRMEVELATAANATATASAVPALQSADVYDADFPVDMASKTPQELRYQAQADYAKAIAALKKEAAEAEAARKEMEAQLRELQAAEAAAANAKAEAERAAQQGSGGRCRRSKLRPLLRPKRRMAHRVPSPRSRRIWMLQTRLMQMQRLLRLPLRPRLM